MTRVLRTLVVTIAVALALAGTAEARGGHYAFDGGTAKQRSQVRQALNASSFNWSVVSETVTIHIVRHADTEAIPGEIWVDSSLLATGKFAWATIQHEYAHEVDFFLFSSDIRGTLLKKLGGQVWFWDVSGLQHASYGCERFASTLAWAYWQSPDNSLRPTSGKDESAAMAPAKFRALIDSLLADQTA